MNISKVEDALAALMWKETACSFCGRRVYSTKDSLVEVRLDVKFFCNNDCFEGKKKKVQPRKELRLPSSEEGIFYLEL